MHCTNVTSPNPAFPAHETPSYTKPLVIHQRIPREAVRIPRGSQGHLFKFQTKRVPLFVLLLERSLLLKSLGFFPSSPTFVLLQKSMEEKIERSTIEEDW